MEFEQMLVGDDGDSPPPAVSIRFWNFCVIQQSKNPLFIDMTSQNQIH